eukprot:1396667-Pyramimonas_sp.AAC.1
MLWRGRMSDVAPTRMNVVLSQPFGPIVAAPLSATFMLEAMVAEIHQLRPIQSLSFAPRRSAARVLMSASQPSGPKKLDEVCPTAETRTPASTRSPAPNSGRQTPTDVEAFDAA